MSYLQFVECTPDSKRVTKVWLVRNKQGQDLGGVHFRPTWRSYVFRFNPTIGEIDFDANCLSEVLKFCQNQTWMWREEHGIGANRQSA